MLNLIKNFRNDRSGAVTVDWVVLTTAVIALGIAAYSAIEGTATDMNEASNAEIGGFASEIFTKVARTKTLQTKIWRCSRLSGCTEVERRPIGRCFFTGQPMTKEMKC